jgi:hypothetical protein
VFPSRRRRQWLPEGTGWRGAAPDRGTHPGSKAIPQRQSRGRSHDTRPWSQWLNSHTPLSAASRVLHLPRAAQQLAAAGGCCTALQLEVCHWVQTRGPVAPSRHTVPSACLSLPGIRHCHTAHAQHLLSRAALASPGSTQTPCRQSACTPRGLGVLMLRGTRLTRAEPEPDFMHSTTTRTKHETATGACMCMQYFFNGQPLPTAMQSLAWPDPTATCRSGQARVRRYCCNSTRNYSHEQRNTQGPHNVSVGGLGSSSRTQALEACSYRQVPTANHQRPKNCIRVTFRRRTLQSLVFAATLRCGVHGSNTCQTAQHWTFFICHA